MSMPSPAQPGPQRHILILGSGGTIAGRGPVGGDGSGYSAGQIGIDTLLADIPGLRQAAGPHGLRSQQIAQIDSADMHLALWQHMAEVCRAQLARADVAAIVLTHGTDTLEETAWLLHSVVPEGKPIVLTCAMRPPTALSADGPANLRDAIACAAAASTQARAAQTGAGQHVLVASAGRIHHPRHVRKAHPYQIDAFDSGEYGPLGWLEPNGPRWAAPAPACPPAPPSHPAPSAMPAAQTKAGATAANSLARGPLPLHITRHMHLPAPAAQPWPWVEILTSHAGADPRSLRALLGAGVDGLILAATGNGTVHADWLAELHRSQARPPVPVWRSTRCALGQIVEPDPAAAAIPACDLPPLKARISLMLALLHGAT